MTLVDSATRAFPFLGERFLIGWGAGQVEGGANRIRRTESYASLLLRHSPPSQPGAVIPQIPRLCPHKRSTTARAAALSRILVQRRGRAESS